MNLEAGSWNLAERDERQMIPDFKHQLSTPDFMFLAKVEGAVVATKKSPNLSGRKLLLLRPQLVDEIII